MLEMKLNPISIPPWETMKYDAAIMNISNFIMASLTAYLSTES